MVADSDAFKGFFPEALTPLILAIQNEYKFTHILTGATAFGKALLPRVSIKLKDLFFLLLYAIMKYFFCNSYINFIF